MRRRPENLRVALIGTRGVPARYGGFETCVEEVGSRLAERGIGVTVYCRTSGADERPPTYRGMELVHLPALHRRSLETLSHTALSVGHVVAHTSDVAVLFNAANAPLLPVLRARGVPVATHVDGLEWQRAKWGRLGRRYYRAAEALAVRWSDALIADATGIQNYYAQEFGAESEFIAYGAPLLEPGHSDRLAELDLAPGGYHLVVARFEPENHVLEMVEGFSRSAATLPLVVVGSAPYADAYTAKVRASAGDRVRFLGGVWDQELLDQLYANSLTYLHGHSVGGTNPSLLRAMGAGAAVIAYDVDFNREVLDAAGGRWFRTSDDIPALLLAAEASPECEQERGARARVRARAYDWDDVADAYEALCRRLADGDRGPRPGGRRTGLSEHSPTALGVGASDRRVTHA